MTEQELTEAAILKAKTGKQEVQSKPNPAKKEQADETIKPKVDIKKYPFNVKLGKNKEVNFKPWTGKTKKKFKKLFVGVEDMSDVDFAGIIKVLIRDNISNKDLYISETEQQYLTALLRKESIGDGFEFSAACNHCNEEQKIKTSISETVKYKMNNYPTLIDDVEYCDIESNTKLTEVIENITNSADYDGLTSESDIEFAMHIKIPDNDNPLGVLDYLDDMPLRDLEVIVKNSKEAAGEFTMSVDKTCVHCGKKAEFIASEIPGLFESLLV